MLGRAQTQPAAVSDALGEVSLAARLAFTLRMLGLIERRVLADNRWAERNVERALRAILDALQTFDADPALATKLLDWVERLIFLTGSWTYLRGEISLRRQAGAA